MLFRSILRHLLRLAREDARADVRRRAVGGLGFLGDRRAIRPLARLLARDPGLTWVPETLTRLGALGGYWLPGVDLSPARRGQVKGWGRCHSNPSRSTDHFLGRTWCAMAGQRARLRFALRRPFPATLLLRYRALQPGLAGGTLRLWVNGRALRPSRLAPAWRRVRVPTETGLWRRGQNEVRLRVEPPPGWRAEGDAGLVALDYLALAGRGGRSRAGSPARNDR